MIRRFGKLVRVASAAVGILIAAGGCAVACPLGIDYGLEVEVFDALTNAPLAAEAVGRVYAGETVVDSLEVAGPPAADARRLVAMRVGAGRYTVRITREGYVPWEQADVIVRHSGGDCGGLRTRELQAALQPLE